MINELKKLRELTETLTGQGYLRDRATEWEYVLDALPDCIYIVNNNYELKFINKALKERLGVERKADVYDVKCFKAIKGMPDPTERPISKPTEVFLPDLSGWFSVSRSPITTKNNKLLGFIVILKDVSAKREAEFNLLARQQMLETIYRASPIGIGIVEHDTRKIKFVNQALSIILGYTEDQLVNNSARLVYPDEEEFLRVGREKHGRVTKERVVSLETRWKRIDGEILDIFLSSSMVAGGNDIVFTAMDITDVKRNERLLKRNEERLEALLKLSKLSHLDEENITQYALEEAVRLTDSRIGYLHFVQEEHSNALESDVNLNLFTWTDSVRNICRAEKVAHYPLSHAGIWADCVRKRAPVVHNDYDSELDKKGLPEGHVKLVRHMCVPVFDGDSIVAVAGVGNKESKYTQTDVYQLSVFMNSMWEILKIKRTEILLAASELKAQRYLDIAGTMILVINRDQIVELINQRGCEILGYKEEEIVGKNWFDIFILPEQRDEIRAVFEHTMNSPLSDRKYGTYENPILTKDGTQKTILWRNSLITNSEGKITGVVCSGEDVTEINVFEDQLKRSEARFRTAFMTIPDASLILEAGTGLIIDVNAALCRVSGFERQELIGRPITDLNIWESIGDRDFFYQVLQRYGHVENFPVKVRLKSGELREAVLTSRIFEIDNRVHVMSILKDISSIVNMWTNICETENLYKNIIDRIYEGVFLIQDRKFVLVNKPLSDMLGYTVSELEGLEFIKIVATEERERVLQFHNMRISGATAPTIYDTKFLTKNGEVIIVTVDANSISYNGKRASMGTITKVTK